MMHHLSSHQVSHLFAHHTYFSNPQYLHEIIIVVTMSTPIVLMLIAGACVNGSNTIITAAVSADLVSLVFVHPK